MNARKPFASAGFRDCTSRSRIRCSMRSARVSTCPNIMVADLFQLTNMRYFGRAQGMELEPRIERFELTEQGGVEAEPQFWVVAALKKELVSAPAKGLLNFSLIGVNVRDIGIGVTGDAIEVTEFAVGDTNI